MSTLLHSVFGLSIVAFFIVIAKLLNLIINKKYGALNRATKIKLTLYALIPLVITTLSGYLANVELGLVSDITQIFFFLLLLVGFAFFAKKRKAQKSKQD
jgi:hypothetical protein